MTETAEAFSIHKVMAFYPLEDAETTLRLCGFAWQEGGTGDVIVSAHIPFGTDVGSRGLGPYRPAS